MGFDLTPSGTKGDRVDPALLALWNSKRVAYGIPGLDKRGHFDPMGVAHLTEKVLRGTWGAQVLAGLAIVFKVIGFVSGNLILKLIGKALQAASDSVAHDVARIARGIPELGAATSVALEFAHALHVMLQLKAEGFDRLLPFAPYVVTNHLGIDVDYAKLPRTKVDSALWHALGHHVIDDSTVRKAFGDNLAPSERMNLFGKMHYLTTGIHYMTGDVIDNGDGTASFVEGTTKSWPETIFEAGSFDVVERWRLIARGDPTPAELESLALQSRRFECRAALAPLALDSANSIWPEFLSLVGAGLEQAKVDEFGRQIRGQQAIAAEAQSQAQADDAMRFAIAKEAADATTPTVDELRATIGNPSEAFEVPVGVLANQMPEPVLPPPPPPPSDALPADPPTLFAGTDAELPEAPAPIVVPDFTITDFEPVGV